MLVHFAAISLEQSESFVRLLNELKANNSTAQQQLHTHIESAVTMLLAAIEAAKQSTSSNIDLDRIVQSLQKVDIGYTVEQAFLDSLYLPVLTLRERQIVNASDRTFEWLYGQAHKANDTGFKEWLTSGKGVYYITGKPGSGKSTLMKFIMNDDRTFSFLQEWAGQSQLVTAVGYFWISGDIRQRSLVGVFRSMFYHLLSKHRHLIQALFPWRWRRLATNQVCAEDWCEDEFLQALESLPSLADKNYKFCFFIDGLDEFEGDHKKLTILLHELTKIPCVKLCVSSRPWGVFETSFSKSATIYIDEWTREDMEQFVKQQLGTHPRWTILQQQAPYHAGQLYEYICESASGVFLWTHLVVRALRDGLDAGDSLAELEIELKKMPPDLEGFFQRMFDNLLPQHQRQAMAYLKLRLRARMENPFWMYLYAEEQDSVFGESAIVAPVTASVIIARYQQLLLRIKSRCRDLLEIKLKEKSQFSPFSQIGVRNVQNPDLQDIFDEGTKVEFTHRCVRDFLLTASSGSKLDLRQTETDTVARGSRDWELQALLASIKTLSITQLRKDYHPILGRLVFTVIHFWNDEQSEPSIHYLDQLKQAGEYGMQGHTPWWPGHVDVGLVSDRPEFLPSPQHGSTFLQLAVRFGFLHYVETKLFDKNCDMPQAEFEHLFSVLKGVVDMFPSIKKAILLERASAWLYEHRADSYYWNVNRLPVADSEDPIDYRVDYCGRFELVANPRGGNAVCVRTYKWCMSDWDYETAGLSPDGWMP